MTYFGIDLRPEQVEANCKNAAEVLGEEFGGKGGHKFAPLWLCGDSVEIDTLAEGYDADFVFSCPPYSDLEVYSNDPADLSTMDYPDFLQAYKEIIRKSCSLLKPDRFAVFVVERFAIRVAFTVALFLIRSPRFRKRGCITTMR